MDAKELLIKLQNDNNLSHGQMIEKLGIDRQTWWRIRAGKQEPSNDLLVCAKDAFPERTNEIIALMKCKRKGCKE